MQKLSQIENKLIKLVEYNDYEQLEKLIMENKFNINKPISKKNEILLGLSILYKSKECFDYLINHPSFNIHLKYPQLEIDYGYWDRYKSDDESDEEQDDSESVSDSESENQEQNDVNKDDEDNSEQSDSDNSELGYISFTDDDYNRYLGVERAVNIFLNAPNFPNSYYLREMINHSFYISPKILAKFDNHNEIYNLIIMKIGSNNNYLINLLYQLIIKGANVDIIYEKVKNLLNINQKNNLIRVIMTSGRIYHVKLLLNDINNFNYPKSKANMFKHVLFEINRTRYSRFGLFETQGYNEMLDYLIKTQPITNCKLTQLAKIIMYGSCTDRLVMFNDKLKQIKLEQDLSPHVAKVINKHIAEYYGQVNWSSFNQLLKLGWCKTNIFEHIKIPPQDIERIKILGVEGDFMIGVFSMGIYHKMDPSSMFEYVIFKDYKKFIKENLVKEWCKTNIVEYSNQEKSVKKSVSKKKNVKEIDV